MHPYTVLQIICTGFFFPPSFHFFHILLSYINTPQTHNLPSPGPVLHFHHPHKFSGKPELESNLSKLFWHTTKPKAMSCHATWTQQPLVLFTAAFWSFQNKEFPCNTHSTERAEGDISSQTWVFVLLHVPEWWLQPVWRNISRFENWS